METHNIIIATTKVSSVVWEAVQRREGSLQVLALPTPTIVKFVHMRLATSRESAPRK